MCRNSVQFLTFHFSRYSLYLKVFINTYVHQFTYILYAKCNEKIEVFKREWTEVIFTIFKFTVFMYLLPPNLFLYYYFFFLLDPPSVNSQTGCCRKYIEIVHVVAAHRAKEPVLYTQKRSTQYQQSAGKEYVNKPLVNTRLM